MNANRKPGAASAPLTDEHGEVRELDLADFARQRPTADFPELVEILQKHGKLAPLSQMINANGTLCRSRQRGSTPGGASGERLTPMRAAAHPAFAAAEAAARTAYGRLLALLSRQRRDIPAAAG